MATKLSEEGCGFAELTKLNILTFEVIVYHPKLMII
jgi:hypothetical protein